MSGHEQTSRHVRVMSVIPLKADIHQRGLHVRFVPRPDMIGDRWLSAMINRDPRGLSIVYESGQALRWRCPFNAAPPHLSAPQLSAHEELVIVGRRVKGYIVAKRASQHESFDEFAFDPIRFLLSAKLIDMSRYRWPDRPGRGSWPRTCDPLQQAETVSGLGEIGSLR
jgi:hypothetical protein